MSAADTGWLVAALAAQERPVCGDLTPFTVISTDRAEGTLRLRFAAQPLFSNHFGHVQGGFAVAMIDVLLAITGYVATERWLPTAEVKSSFLRPLPIATCEGTGRVLRAGRNLVFAEASLIAPDGRPAVVASATLLGPDAAPAPRVAGAS